MTTAGSDHSSKVLLRTAANMWANGGVQRYYRGLTVSTSSFLSTLPSSFEASLLSLGVSGYGIDMSFGFSFDALQLSLVGVFPYAAIDMSTFETLKIAYCRHFGIEEPETYATLAFGAVSGGVGATSVYRAFLYPFPIVAAAVYLLSDHAGSGLTQPFSLPFRDVYSDQSPPNETSSVGLDRSPSDVRRLL
jgi:hypothetical protein